VRDRGLGIGRDGREWLLDLVDDGGGEFAHQRQPRGVGEFEARQGQLPLGLLEPVTSRQVHRTVPRMNRNALEVDEQMLGSPFFAVTSRSTFWISPRASSSAGSKSLRRGTHRVVPARRTSSGVKPKITSTFGRRT
jgi:hypothetical protein